jgi:hypothetical protein
MLAIQVEERRQTDKDLNYFWNQLNLAQKFSAAELQRYGYQLRFVRNIASGKLAVLDNNGKLAAIDHDGLIDTEPKIVLRH